MFLPVSKADMEARGWSQADFVLVTGDAYVDHPSFGAAIIGRWLMYHGYKVAVLAQPDWKSCKDFTRFGKPRLGFLIGSGNVDSMVNHFSVFRHRRKQDVYSPGGKAGKRPDRAVIVYSNRAREAYRDAPIIIGGLEASLRRLAHYDYWEDKVRRSILLDAKADLLVYGMGERATVEIADALDAGIAVQDIGWIRGTCFRGKMENAPLPMSAKQGAGKSATAEEDAFVAVREGGSYDEDSVLLPAFATIKADPKTYCDSFLLQYENQDFHRGKQLIEPYDTHTCVVQNPPQPVLEREELDQVYGLPYERKAHPMYPEGVPALEEVRFSLVSSRGCFGGCAFCALAYHQGREVRSRSKASLLQEAEMLIREPDFKGYIHDVGGPTANFRKPACTKQLTQGTCARRDCLFPRPCKDLEVDHGEYLEVLRALRVLPKVKKVFIRSGIRYDYLMADKQDTFFSELCQHHISGTLKVAPEHSVDKVLAHMRKPKAEAFLAFSRKYKAINKKLGRKQYLIPYLISSHPGSTLSDAIELALFLQKEGFVPDQVQDFYPTPGTLSTCMYYAGLDPFTKTPVHVAKGQEEKKLQRALLHFHKPQNHSLVKKALLQANRQDLLPVLLGRKRV